VENTDLPVEGAEPGLADSGDLQHDLPDLFTLVGEGVKAAGKGWVLLIDEVQYLSEDDLSALIVAMHRMAQRGLPVVMVGAGLPQVAKLAGEAKSYAARLFQYPAVGALNEESAKLAVRKPVEEEGEAIEDAALDAIFARTKGYSFFGVDLDVGRSSRPILSIALMMTIKMPVCPIVKTTPYNRATLSPLPLACS
jgi:hypothetical protein